METEELRTNKAFFNRLAHSYDNGIFRWGMRKFLNTAEMVIFNAQNTKKSLRILDASCGTGELLHSLSLAHNKQLHGIDIAEEMV